MLLLPDLTEEGTTFLADFGVMRLIESSFLLGTVYCSGALREILSP